MEPWNPLDVFRAISMSLGIEVDDALVSMLPFGPWSRFQDWMGKEES